jgi:pre-mRNA-processing factor 6
MSGIGPKTANTYKAPAPTYYVAGVGRGATGFTTRSDIGPARPAPGPPGSEVSFGQPPPGYVAGMGRGMGGGIDVNFGQAPVGYVAGRGRGMGELARGQGELTSTHVKQEQEREDYSESNYDEFSGYGEKLFAQGTYEQDDHEADAIYGQVDELMESRRKRSREQQMLLEQRRARTDRPRIADQFADLKRQLSAVTDAEWDAIPEVGDHSLKLKQSRKKETFMPVPDFVIESASQRNGLMNQAVDPNDGGMSVFGRTSGAASVFSGGLAEARGSALSQKLDKMSDSVTGQTVVDPKGYLTSLNSVKVNSQAEVGDIKRARLLLQSVTTTNPKHAPGWIAAARVEEVAGKMVQARKVIIQVSSSIRRMNAMIVVLQIVTIANVHSRGVSNVQRRKMFGLKQHDCIHQVGIITRVLLMYWPVFLRFSRG